MANVLKVDVPGTAGDAYAEKTLTLPGAFYAEYRWAVTQATLTNLSSGGPGGDVNSAIGLNFTGNAGDGLIGVDFGTIGVWKVLGDFDPAYGAGAAAGSLTGDAWHTVKLYYDGTDITWTFDGAALFTYALAAANLDTPIQFGATFEQHIAGVETYYLADLKIGTTLGGTDIFAPDISVDLSDFDSTTNPSALSIVADPFPATAHGILIAFDDPVLTETPTWTDLGGLAGVSVQRVQIQRGRPTERDKTQVGTATISGICTTGILDPTYAAGALFGKLDPMKQVMIELQDPVTTAWSSVFRGFVSDWNYELDISENTYTFEIVCEDALAIIADAEVIPDVAGNTVPTESTGDVYYDPVASNDDRILAAIADTATTFNPYGADWPSGLLSFFSGNTQVKGAVYSPRSSLLGVIDDAADADLPWGSNRYVSKTGIITFHGRLTRFDPTNPTYGVTFWTVGDEAAFAGDSTTAVISGLKFTRGKTNLINAALVTPRDIADADIAGQFSSDATSITAFGARSVSFENLLTDGSSPGASWGPTTDLGETKLMADGLVANYKDPRDRIRELTFRPQGTSGARATAAAALICGVELNDVLTTTTTHPGGGGFSAEDQFVESLGYTWDVEGGSSFTNVTLTVEVSPRANWNTNPFA